MVETKKVPTGRLTTDGRMNKRTQEQGFAFCWGRMGSHPRHPER
jgi:hypothetical protein